MRNKKIMAEEVWKDIPGFENKYQVSTMGRVRSLPRITKYINYKGTKCKVEKQRIPSPPSTRCLWICSCSFSKR